MTGLMAQFFECDSCGMFTNRIHKCVAAGTDTAACDECYGYDAEAYGEELAQFLTLGEYKANCAFEVQANLDAAIQAASAAQIAESLINILCPYDLGLLVRLLDE